MAANDVTTDLMLGFSTAMTKPQALSYPSVQARPSSQSLTALPSGSIDARTLGILGLSSVLQAKEADVPRHRDIGEDGGIRVDEQQQILQHVLNHQLRLHLQQLSAANINHQSTFGLQHHLPQGEAFQRSEAPAFGPALVSATTSQAQTTGSGDTLLTAKPVVDTANPAIQASRHSWGVGHPAIVSDDIKVTPRESSGDSNVEVRSATADMDPLERSQGHVEKRKRESPETMDNGKSVRPRTVAERKRRNTISFRLEQLRAAIPLCNPRMTTEALLCETLSHIDGLRSKIKALEEEKAQLLKGASRVPDVNA
jgi:hypothetical protein